MKNLSRRIKIYQIIKIGIIKIESTWLVTDLEEVLDALGVVAVALTTDALHLFDLAGLTRGLDVLEVHLCVLAEVHNGSKEVKQT